MSLKIIGKKEDVEKYKEILKDRRSRQKSFEDENGVTMKKKPEGFCLMYGEISACSYDDKFSQEPSTKGNMDPDARLYLRGIANARMIDRMDEIVEPAGGDFKHFNASPILLADHMYWCSSAIGQVTGLMPEFDGLHFEAWIGDPQAAPLTDKQREVRSLVAQRILKTVSIGFIPNEIKAPTWDNEGTMLTPAYILKWQLLEISVVAIPANPGSTFEMRQFTNLVLNGNNTPQEKTLTEILGYIDNETKADSTIVQTLIFDKKKFTVAEAKKWARDHEFKSDKVDETTDSIRLRQRDPGEFIDGSFRTIELTDGVKAVIGRLKDDLEMEKKLDELIDSMKTLSGGLESLKGEISKNVEISNSILGIISDKGCKPGKDDEKEKGESEDVKSLKEEVTTLKQKIDGLEEVLKALIERI